MCLYISNSARSGPKTIAVTQISARHKTNASLDFLVCVSRDNRFSIDYAWHYLFVFLKSLSLSSSFLALFIPLPATHPVLATGLSSLPYRNYKTRTVRNISLSRDNWSCSRVIDGCIAMTWCRSMLTLIVTSSSSQRCFTMARSCRILINVKAIVLSFPWATRTKTSRRLGGHRAYCFSIRSMTARAAGTLVVASRTNISFCLDSWERCRRKRELDLTHWLCTLR